MIEELFVSSEIGVTIWLIISPIIGANLNPWPEQQEQISILDDSPTQSITKSLDLVFV